VLVEHWDVIQDEATRSSPKAETDVRRHISGVCVNGSTNVVQDLAALVWPHSFRLKIFRKSSQNFSPAVSRHPLWPGIPKHFRRAGEWRLEQRFRHELKTVLDRAMPCPASTSADQRAGAGRIPPRCVVLARMGRRGGRECVCIRVVLAAETTSVRQPASPTDDFSRAKGCAAVIATHRGKCAAIQTGCCVSSPTGWRTMTASSSVAFCSQAMSSSLERSCNNTFTRARFLKCCQRSGKISTVETARSDVQFAVFARARARTFSRIRRALQQLPHSSRKKLPSAVSVTPRGARSSSPRRAHPPDRSSALSAG